MEEVKSIVYGIQAVSMTLPVLTVLVLFFAIGAFILYKISGISRFIKFLVYITLIIIISLTIISPELYMKFTNEIIDPTSTSYY